MEQVLKPGAWRAAALPFANCGRWPWGLRYRSAGEQRTPAAGRREEGPPAAGHGGAQLLPAARSQASRAVTRSSGSRGGQALQRQPRQWDRPYESGAGPGPGPGSSGESGSAKAKKRLGQKLLFIERTKGSEILFGVAPCSMALSQSRRDLFRLFLKESSSSRQLIMSEFVLQAMAQGVPVHHITKREMNALCKGGVHQGVCLEASPLRFKSLEEDEKPGLEDKENLKQQLIWLVLEQIQDPMNMGALLRSAYFLGVDRVVTSQRNSCPLTPTVSKASSGAMEVLDVYSTDDIQGFLKAKTAEGWEVVGTVAKPEDVENVPVISCLEFRWSRPVIIVIGNEGDGLSLETQLLCHRMLSIPPGRVLHPGIESLNVSVATGIFLHSICSQKLRHSD